MKFQIIGAVLFVMLGAWMATFTDPIKDTFSNYEVDREVYTVYAGDLAKRIIDGDQSFMLIDIRGATRIKKSISIVQHLLQLKTLKKKI